MALQMITLDDHVAYNKSSAVAEMGDRFSTIDMDRKFGGCCAPLGQLHDPHLTKTAWVEAYVHMDQMAS